MNRKMKRVVLSLVCLLSLAASCFLTDCALNAKTIRGNGKAVTKEYRFDEIDKISLAGSAACSYTQSDAAPQVTLTIDENLLDYVEVTMKAGALSVGPKLDRPNGGSSYNLQPTTYKVEINSKALRRVELAGSGSFTTNAMQVERVKFDLAGSGSVKVAGLQADKVSCDVAGSGNVLLKGRVRDASFDLAGSGSIDASGCEAEEVEGDIAGSGNMEVFATKQLKGDIAGSGKIYYKGSPKVKSDTVGSGKVVKR